MSDNKRRVAIVTDSTSSLTQAMGRGSGIHVVPIEITAGSQTYRDGIDLDADLFYRLLLESKSPPISSQPTVAAFLQTYSSLAQQAEAIVSIHISREMSATLESAQSAREALPEVPIYVIDSRSVSMGLGLIAISAARAAAAGQDATKVVQLVEELIPRMNTIFTVDTLEYLRKGGRIGGAAALLGLALSIKPVLYVKDGRIEPLEKTRTRRRALERVLELVDQRTAPSTAMHAAVLHCAAPEAAQALADQVASRYECEELLTVEAGPVIGTHAGPGTLGVAFYTV